MPKRFPTKPPKGNVNSGDLGDDSSASETAGIRLSEEDLQLRAKKIDEAWPPGTVAQLDPSGKDPECKIVIVLACHGEKELAFSEVLVHDGEAEWWVAPEWLRRLEVASELGPRMVARAHATTFPRCSVSKESLWDWLSPGGFPRLEWWKSNFPVPAFHM